MSRNHLWRGEWLDDAELAARLPALAEAIAADFDRPPPLKALLAAAEALGKDLRRASSLRGELFDTLLSSPDARPDEANATLDSIAAFLDREVLEHKLRRELGGTDPFTPRRIGYDDHRFEAWCPLGLLVHVAPGNVSSVAPLSVVEGLLAGNINFLKTSTNATLFPQRLLAALLDHDPGGELAPFVYAARLSSREPEKLRQLFAAADGISAWGGETAIAAVRSMAPPGVRVVEWGHKISFAYLAAEKLHDEASLAAVARDVCKIEQQACSSPQCLYIEAESREQLFDFAARFARLLGEVSTAMPVKEPTLQEQAEITTVSEMARLDGIFSGETRVFTAADRSWRVFAENHPALRASPLYRSLWIKPLLPRDMAATLRPMRPWLQTAGLACELTRFADLSSRLIAAGVSRITRVGEQLGGYAGAPHDGVYALQRYCRRVSFELPDAARGISSFHELHALPPSPLASGTPLLAKEEFLSLPPDPTHAQLYFKSGGSSGTPKLSVYSWDDYRTQMRAAADGLYAAGLDPTRDRVMNLFFSGHLYGSFISFWSILEHLGATQFPMTGIDDLEEVARTIVAQRVDTLLGMPFYLTSLFTQQADILRSYGGIKKIFFGGEHFNAVQRQRLKEEFGVEIIRAAIYGSNDAGPLGYQCPACDDSAYHLLTQTQFLEILDLDADHPVAAGEPGRLVFTSLARRGQKVERYDIGDLGRWLEGPCRCGRAAPRFELLGRHGDLFRAPYFFNYQTFCRVLADHADYGGAVQLVLSHGEKDQILLRLEEGAGLEPEAARQLLLSHYPDLRQFVEESKFTDLVVERLPLARFETTPATGKLKHIVDLRRPA
ncbi:MAG: acyl-CoA reductase [Sulfuricellaceae bacterium]|jgi:phenylacetate-coenzyme A ligase PaaK-like adenylate-forming protein